MNQFELRLNAKHVDNDPFGYLVVEANIDERPLTDFGKCAVDLSHFERSMKSNGEFFIITCWCGDPACANIRQGVMVSHIDNKVIWKTNLHGQAFYFEFDKASYIDARNRLQKQVKELLSCLNNSANDGDLTIVPSRNRPFLNN